MSPARWPTWEPRVVRSTCIQFICPLCGWTGERVAPEKKGTFVAITSEAQAHLDIEHLGRWAS